MDVKEEKMALYNIMVQSIASNEQKRLQANTTYTTLTVAMIAIPSSLKSSSLIIAAILFCVGFIWYFTIRYHLNLAKAKFHVLLPLENTFCVKLFSEEWACFKKLQRQIELTHIEKIMPLIICIMSFLYLGYKLLFDL